MGELESKQSNVMSIGRRTTVRWVTWWPISYWFPRFAELARRPGIDLEVIFLSGSSPHYEAFSMADVRFPYRILSDKESTSAFYKPTFELRNFLDIASGVDRLVLHYADLSCALASVIRRLRRQPYHLFVANTFKDARSSSYGSEIAKRFVFQGASGYLPTGPLQMDYARHYGSSEKSMTVIGNPVDSAYFARHADRLLPLRDELRRTRGWQNRFVLGYVGRLAPEKKLSTLIRAARSLLDEGVPVLVALAGTGPERESLEAEAKATGVPVAFPGFLKDEGLCEFYASLDAFILPSVSEPWGLVVNEAMEFRIPVLVSSNVGAQHLIHTGTNGYVFPVGDAGALAANLSNLAHDPSVQIQMGEAARKRADQETVESWADAVLQGLSLTFPTLRIQEGIHIQGAAA